jgi:predicted CoA-binding protein
MSAAVTRENVEQFLACRTLALAGASRSGKKFGNAVLRELVANGYRVTPVHPSARELEGIPCVPALSSLGITVDGLVLVVPPAQTEELVRQAAQAGISRVWMQRGTESARAVEFCREKGMMAVHGHCLLMFLRQSAGFHRFHRWLWGMLGKLPA